MKRRDFLLGAAAVAGLAATRGARAQGLGRPAPLDRLAIMTWSFDRVIQTPDRPGDPARTLDLLDVPQMYADRYGVHHVEVQHDHFVSNEPAYLKEMRDRTERVGSRISQINLEFHDDLTISATSNPRRLEAIELSKRWVDHAVELGCPRVMVNQGSLAPEVMETATAALRAIGEYGRSRGIMVTMENRGRNWEAVEAVVRAAGTRTTPDLGNFSDQEAQHRGIRALFPMNSGNAHVKLNPARYDLPAALALTKEIGYDGLYSIEANPSPQDPYEAVQAIKDVLMANL